MGPPFLTSALDGDVQSASRPGRSIPGEIAPDIYRIGGWVVARTSLDTVEKTIVNFGWFNMVLFCSI
jgi:hypothetical protein